MSHCLSAIKIVLHHTILINSNSRKEIECVLVTWLDPVEYKADDNLLPGWATFIPEFGLLQIDLFTDKL